MKIIQLFTFIVMIFFIIPGCANFKRADLPIGKQVNLGTSNYWIADFSQTSGLNYIITFPKQYEIDTNKAWPIILFLHSMAERGENIQLIMNNSNGEGNGIATYALTNNQFQFITISPLCPKDSYWPIIDERLNQLLNNITKKYRINLNKIYLTGISMGGMGVWSLAMKYPDWFAAIAPISGGIYFPPMIENVKALRNIPVWAFHDRNDPEIPISKEEDTIKRLQDDGNIVKYTVSETGKHYIHEDVYKKGDLFKWFLEYEKK